MRRIAAMMGAAAMVLLLSSSVFAQANFSGKWTREAPAGGGAAAGGGGGGGRAGGGGGGGGRGGGGGGGFNCGAACEIVASAASIKVTRDNNGTAVTWTCTLDGKDCTNEQPGRQGGAPTQVVASAKMEGGKIVITRKADMNGTSVTFTQTLAIDAGKLVVTTTSTMEGAQPQTATYTKG